MSFGTSLVDSLVGIATTVFGSGRTTFDCGGSSSICIGSAVTFFITIGRSGSIMVSFLKTAVFVACGFCSFSCMFGVISVESISGDFGDVIELLIIRGADDKAAGGETGVLTGSGEVLAVGIATTIGSCCFSVSTVGLGSMLVNLSILECALNENLNYLFYALKWKVT